MMQFENMMTFTRAIKGAPASVLWALVITQRMMTALELQQWTGYKGDNITASVRLLEQLGWVVARTPRGPWGLVEGRQLPLMAGLAQLEEPENDPLAKVDSFTRTDSDLIGVSGRNLSSSSSRRAISTIEPKEEQETDDSDLIGVVAQNLSACDEAGIREPKRSLISKLRHVTPGFIEAHVRQAAAEAMPLGTAIHRIQHNWSYDLRFEKERTKINWMCEKCHRVITACICEEEE